MPGNPICRLQQTTHLYTGGPLGQTYDLSERRHVSDDIRLDV